MSHLLRGAGESLDGAITPRTLQQDDNDETCECCVCPSSDDDNKPVTTIQMLAVGGDDHYLNFIPNRFSQRAEAFYNRTGVQVQVQRLGDLDNLNKEILADVKAQVYDGYCFIPFLTGSLLEDGGLADLTDFVRTNVDVNWTDIFRFNREVQAVYDNSVRLIPCDGDVHSLYYRKDLFEAFNVTVPRTWDEYNEVAEFFHGREVELPGSPNNTTTLVGSCVGRKPSCLDFGFFNILVHSSLTQAGGTTKGALFDPKNMNPLMGEAMAETLRHLETQIKYGAPDELTSDRCSGLNIDLMNEGRCAMTYMWGDSFARHLLEGSVIGGRLGIAPTPGTTKVLDRKTQKLAQCTEEVCPFGESYPDIGRVNRAPYAAAGGWSVGVSSGVDPARQEAMAEFFGLVCGTKESIEDVIPFAQGPLFTGTDPYRISQFDIEKWVERGYPRDTTIQYRDTIEEQLGSENTVIDIRFPEAFTFLTAMHDRIFAHLNESQSMIKTHEDRLAVADSIDAAWREITRAYDSRDDTSLPLLAIYQKSLNVYNPQGQSEGGLTTGAIVGIVLGCSAFAAIVAGISAYVLIRRERQKTKDQWVIKREDMRLTDEILGEGSFGVITKGYLRGTPVAVKACNQFSRLESDLSSKDSSHKTKRGGGVAKYSSVLMKEDLAALVKLRHPRLVQTIGAMIEGKNVFVVFEFMEKGSLAAVLADPGGIAGSAGKEVELQWARQVAEGLQFLHGVPLLHENLKASNVLIDSSYNAKVSGFALESRVIGQQHSQGSLLWTAPEVLNGEKASIESDIYSYGMTLYEILARARPFQVRRFSKSTLTEITESVFSDSDDEFMADPAEMQRIEYYGEQNGHKATVPELVGLVSDLTLEPPVRPELPDGAPQLLKDLCTESWHKNPKRRPTIEEIVERLTSGATSTSLTQQLVSRSTVFDSILPHHVQQALSKGETVPPETYEEVTVIFSDVVGFTATSSILTAEEVGDLIARLFTKFDQLADKYGVKKVDVIGDAFLGVCGIPNRNSNHAPRAACFALEAIAAAQATPICLAKPQLGNVQVRFGLATGPVVAAVIGSAQHPKYTLFGNTVNTASRMESSSEADRVQCTQETALLIQDQAPVIGVEYRQRMDIKGRGEMETFFLNAPAGGFETLTEAFKATVREPKRRASVGEFSQHSSGLTPSVRSDEHSMKPSFRANTSTLTTSDIGEDVTVGSMDGGDKMEKHVQGEPEGSKADK